MNNKAIGGSHYESDIEPIDLIEQLGLTFHEGNVVKYVTRHSLKNGREDLEKALWYVKRMIDNWRGPDNIGTFTDPLALETALEAYLTANRMPTCSTEAFIIDMICNNTDRYGFVGLHEAADTLMNLIKNYE
jgi:hypothetical protein